MGYADHTDVPVVQTKADLERLIIKYRGDQYITGWDSTHAMIGFRIDRRFVRIKLPMPLRVKFNTENQFEQGIKARWRALYLVVKAKFVAVESGISTVEREFLADVVMPDGTVIGEWLQPQIERAYKTGEGPSPLLPAAGNTRVVMLGSGSGG